MPQTSISRQHHASGIARKGKIPSTLSTSRKACDEAFNLISMLGMAAGDQAEYNARQARERGNHIHFSFWRDVGRIVAYVQGDNMRGLLN